MTHSARASCTSLLFLPHFDVICDLLLNRPTALEAVCEILVNLGIPTQKKFTYFFSAVGYDWNAVVQYTYTQSLDLYQMKLARKNIKIVYSCQKSKSFVF